MTEVLQWPARRPVTFDFGIMTPITALYGRKASEGTHQPDHGRRDVGISTLAPWPRSSSSTSAPSSPRSACGSSPACSASVWAITGLLTHRGYKMPKWVEYFLTLCGTLALEGGPIFWVATHRIHHQYSDKDRRSALSPRGHVLGPHGLDFHRQSDAPRHRGAAPLRSRSQQGSLPRGPHHVALGSPGCCGPHLSRVRRHFVCAVGGFLPHRRWSALHVAGQFRHASVGLAPFQDA